mgnify:CR=1 FL=1
MKIQHKIVAIPLAVMLLVSTVTFILIETYLESHLIESNKNELTTLASASLESVRTLESVDTHGDEHVMRSFQRLAENFAHAGDFRITYIDANGRVLGDSDISFDQLPHIENHADRAEIELALATGKGISERYSTTLNTEMLYVAVRSNEGHYTDKTSHLAHPIIARIARSQSSIQAAIYELRATLLLAGTLSLLAVLILGLFGARIMKRTVQNEQQLLEKRVEDRTTEISILQTFGGLLNACSTLDEASEVLNNVIPKLLPEFKGSISIIKSSRNRLDHIASWGGDWPGSERFAPGECWSLRKGHQHLSTEHGIQTLCHHWIEIPSDQQTLCIPLLAQGETIGVLHFVMSKDVSLDHYKGLSNAISEQVGLTLANIQLRDSLREQAIRDPLTGLFNRRYMLEALDQSHSRAERTQTEIAIMMIDLDHFKLFNDNFGHDAGDHVLKAVSQVLKDSLRQEDIACRYGGEEFCIVCPATTEQQALQIAKRIGKGISSLELNMNQLSLGTVTTSIGIALYPTHAENMEDTIKAADEALYVAKQNGRDRVEIAQAIFVEKADDQPALEAEFEPVPETESA